MRIALLRLEDVGPGGHYETEEAQTKLAIVGERLLALKVPYQVAVIARFVDPARGIDRSVASPADSVANRFVWLLRRWNECGVSLGMHGYTHQYGTEISGEGYEFAYPGCTANCPPDDSPDSLHDSASWSRSYAYGRYRMALASFRASGLRPDWFETPHYAASPVQRRILEACCPILYETNPDAPESRRVTFRQSKSASGWTLYVPTPLSYVGGSTVRKDVQRILSEASRYAPVELASFFFHPFLEFPYIRLRSDGSAVYEENSPLHLLVRGIGELGRRFVSIRDLLRDR